MKGKYIVIEGIDGSGSTTQGNLAVKWLGPNALSTHEPSPGFYGDIIRKVFQQEDL